MDLDFGPFTYLPFEVIFFMIMYFPIDHYHPHSIHERVWVRILNTKMHYHKNIYFKGGGKSKWKISPLQVTYSSLVMKTGKQHPHIPCNKETFCHECTEHVRGVLSPAKDGCRKLKFYLYHFVKKGSSVLLCHISLGDWLGASRSSVWGKKCSTSW